MDSLRENGLSKEILANLVKETFGPNTRIKGMDDEISTGIIFQEVEGGEYSLSKFLAINDSETKQEAIKYKYLKKFCLSLDGTKEFCLKNKEEFVKFCKNNKIPYETNGNTIIFAMDLYAYLIIANDDFHYFINRQIRSGNIIIN